MAGLTPIPTHRLPPDACHFNINITDSDYALPGELAGECKEEKVEELPEIEAVDDSISDAAGSNPSSSGDMGKSRSSLGSSMGVTSPEDLYYKGLPPGALSKHYRTDYPSELHLKKICAPKPPSKRITIDNFNTQPIASFTPISSKERLQGPGAGDSGNTIPVRKSASGRICQTHGTTRPLPPIVSVSDEVVLDFLEENNLQMLFEYFMGMCILNTPDDPFLYISELAGVLIKGRVDQEGFDAIPRLLTPSHVESMFRLFDRVGAGYISSFQYNNAMDSMGLCKYNREPEGTLEDEILRETFLKEANQAINALLKSFLFKKSQIEKEDNCV